METQIVKEAQNPESIRPIHAVALQKTHSDLFLDWSSFTGFVFHHEGDEFLRRIAAQRVPAESVLQPVSSG